MLAMFICFIAFSAINDTNVRRTTSVGKITEVVFVPGHWAGRVWQNDTWKVGVLVDGVDGFLSLPTRPPAWLTPGTRAVVTYGRGRIDNDVIIGRLQPAQDAAQSLQAVQSP